MHARVNEELRINFSTGKNEPKQLLGLPSPFFSLKNIVTV